MKTKITIISCDMCNKNIYENGFCGAMDGVVAFRARELRQIGHDMAWKSKRLHICPDCVKKLKKYCESKKEDCE